MTSRALVLPLVPKNRRREPPAPRYFGNDSNPRDHGGGRERDDGDVTENSGQPRKLLRCGGSSPELYYFDAGETGIDVNFSVEDFQDLRRRKWLGREKISLPGASLLATIHIFVTDICIQIHMCSVIQSDASIFCHFCGKLDSVVYGLSLK